MDNWNIPHSVKGLRILFDGDVLLHQLGNKYQDEMFGELVTDLEGAILEADTTIEWYMDTFETEDVIMCFSCDSIDNFRRTYYPKYKEDRLKTHRPLLFNDIRGHLRNTYKSILIPTLEADDLIGILSTLTS